MGDALLRKLDNARFTNGIGSVTTIALGLLTVGFGLFVIAQLRRRQPSLA